MLYFYRVNILDQKLGCRINYLTNFGVDLTTSLF